jgi:hypothetical protein
MILKKWNNGPFVEIVAPVEPIAYFRRYVILSQWKPTCEKPDHPMKRRQRDPVPVYDPVPVDRWCNLDRGDCDVDIGRRTVEPIALGSLEP